MLSLFTFDRESDDMTTMVLWLLAVNPSLEVTVTGLHSDAGEVRIAVFSTTEGWPEQDALATRRAALGPKFDAAAFVVRGATRISFAVEG